MNKKDVLILVVLLGAILVLGGYESQNRAIGPIGWTIIAGVVAVIMMTEVIPAIHDASDANRQNQALLKGLGRIRGYAPHCVARNEPLSPHK